MAKKKSVKKRSKGKINASEKKINLVLKNLILFGVLSLISFMLYTVSSNVFYRDLFLLSTMILGFIALAFLIVLLVLMLLRIMKK